MRLQFLQQAFVFTQDDPIGTVHSIVAVAVGDEDVSQMKVFRQSEHDRLQVDIPIRDVNRNRAVFIAVFGRGQMPT